MSWLSFLRRKRRDAELQHEIESFLTEETADNVARGMSPQEARRQARVKFGNAQTVRELLLAQNSLLPLTHFARDLRYAVSDIEPHPRILDHRHRCDGALHRRRHLAVHDRAFGVAEAAASSRCGPFSDHPRALSRGLWRTRRISTTTRLHRRTFTTGARKPTVLKTWRSCVTPVTT